MRALRAQLVHHVPVVHRFDSLSPVVSRKVNNPIGLKLCRQMLLSFALFSRVTADCQECSFTESFYCKNRQSGVAILDAIIAWRTLAIDDRADSSLARYTILIAKIV